MTSAKGYISFNLDLLDLYFFPFNDFPFHLGLNDTYCYIFKQNSIANIVSFS